MSNHIAITLNLLLLLSLSPSIPSHPIALPGCQDHCGDVPIPYPFGIGRNCSHNSNPWFQVTCNTTFDPPLPLTTSLSTLYTQDETLPIEIISIDISPIGTLKAPAFGSVASIRDATTFVQNSIKTLVQLDMRGSPYFIPGNRNSLVLSGCGGSAILRNEYDEIVAGCSTLCTNLTSQVKGNSSRGGGNCYGIGCCQTQVVTSLDYFEMEILTMVLEGSTLDDWIWVAFLDSSFLEDHPVNVTKNLDNTTIPVIQATPVTLHWAVPDMRIDEPQYSNSRCEFVANGKGHSCRCKHEYYEGNPYLPYGCEVINECKLCPDNCTWTFVENTRKYICPPKPKRSPIPIVIGLTISSGSILVFVALYSLYQLFKKRKETRKRHTNYKRNGGLLLQQHISTSGSAMKRSTVFTCDELERATDNFNENRILGQGGQGTVYKGMLVDGTIVAIKKSKKVDQSQLEQFINEVVILSQVNHRHVVKLYGCCLETEVPLLVYEFVPNGTLYQHIHKPSEDFRITWKMRLQIAMESAEALAYLHSSSYAPIYHRDIKTSNILLDDKYKAKVSDFGTSKTILIDQTHVTTCVQGTFGYIDPEFFQSSQFTEKSDVYSFGIVLVELITNKKPIFGDSFMENRSLASEFLSLIEKSRVYDIVDASVIQEAQKEELDGIVEVARKCLHLNGKMRPTMKDVLVTLQMIASQNHTNTDHSPKNLFNWKERLMVNDQISSMGESTLSEDPQHIQEQPFLSFTDSST